MKYGFIGCGNMGSAIARAMAKKTTDFMVTDRSGHAKALAEKLGCAYGTTEAICQEADAIILGVKPQDVRNVLAPLVPVLQERKPLVISMAAGIRISNLQDILGPEIPIIRIMPNTPVAVGRGVVPYTCNALVTEEQEKDLLFNLSRAGFLTNMEESMMEAASTLSGCGPAYVYLFIEALADGAVSVGVPRTTALQFAAATVIGSGEMVLATGQHPSILKDAVCSPDGSTIQGLRVLEEKGVRGAVINSIVAAYKKNMKLGR